ncbi:hypothetical protein BDC45DRAFT_530229 [Circinella umbellata]|nr:hypothetical protein BDC45DRAFT_530229 [Circinella umbellata]
MTSPAVERFCISLKQNDWEVVLGVVHKIPLGQSWIVDPSSGSFGVSVKVSKIPLGQSWIIDPSSGSFGVSSVKVSKIPLGQSWIIDLSSGCFTASSVKFLKVKATRSAIEIASVPTDSTSRNNRFCPGAKLRVSTKANEFSREIEGHFCGISL